jgi:hypothetical protein
LPGPLREFYRFSNGASLLGGDLQIHTLQPETRKIDKPFVNPFRPAEPPSTQYTTRALATETTFLREHDWPISAEVLVFGGDGSDSLFGIWLPKTAGSVFEHPIVEIGEIFDTPKNMAVVGTSLLRFLYSRTADYLLLHRADDGALDAIGVPKNLRSDPADPPLSRIRKWADPNLPDPEPDPYKRGFDAAELRRLFTSP